MLTLYDNNKNCLLASSSNGYVSTYIYDGEGKRTVKQHSGSEALYTNVFVKPNDQSQTHLSFGMVRADERESAVPCLYEHCRARRRKTKSKGRMKSNGM